MQNKYLSFIIELLLSKWQKKSISLAQMKVDLHCIVNSGVKPNKLKSDLSPYAACERTVYQKKTPELYKGCYHVHYSYWKRYICIYI